MSPMSSPVVGQIFFLYHALDFHNSFIAKLDNIGALFSETFGAFYLICFSHFVALLFHYFGCI